MKSIALFGKFGKISPLRKAFLSVISIFLIFFIWALFAPLDEGVPCDGSINVDSKKKTIQHLTGGVVKNIYISEGQNVKKGQVLIELDPEASRARYDEVRHHYYEFRSVEARLLAEQNGSSKILFHPDLLSNKADPLVAQHMQSQENLMKTSRQFLESSVNELQDNISEQEELIKGYAHSVESYKLQKEIFDKQIESLRPLVNEGYAARNDLDELKLKSTQVDMSIKVNETNIAKSRKTISGYKQKIIATKSDYKRKMDDQLATVRGEVDADAQKLIAYKDELARTKIISPVDGQIVGLQFHTIGSAISPGQKIMDVVPVDVPFLIEAKIPPNLIDKVLVDNEADVRFSNFAGQPQLKVDGKVASVSKDIISESNGINQTSYYLARIKLDESAYVKLKGNQLQSGMPVQIVIKTGERTYFNYLIGPFIKRIGSAMKER